MRDAIVLSPWSWEMFNVPERIALALSQRGARVLHCEPPVSRFRASGNPMRELSDRLYSFGPVYSGSKFNSFPFVGAWQWKSVARQMLHSAGTAGLRDPLFLYSHMRSIVPLCERMKLQGLPLIHICMDYPEPYQYELIEISDRTLVIPKAVFHKLRARFSDKVDWIPQSIHLRPLAQSQSESPPKPASLAQLGRPLLGYAGALFGRVNLHLVKDIFASHPEWQFIYFGDPVELHLPNAHTAGWVRQEELPDYISHLDIGVMPYDCFDEKNLHCVPLKLFDYFREGLPVVSTPAIGTWPFADLIYFGETAREFAAAIEHALAEPAASPKRKQRMEVAKAHSTEALGERLEEVLPRCICAHPDRLTINDVRTK